MIDSDTLAKFRLFVGFIFERLNYTAAGVYQEITGQDIDDMKNAYQYRIIKAKLQRDIEYGEGINIQKEWQEYPLVVPKLHCFLQLWKRQPWNDPAGPEVRGTTGRGGLLRSNV